MSTPKRPDQQAVIRTPERIIPMSEVHYDPDHGLHMLTDCEKVHGNDAAPPAPIERTDPDWYPLALRILAAHHPAISDILWAAAIHDNTGHLGVLLHLALDYPKTNAQVWAAVIEETRRDV